MAEPHLIDLVVHLEQQPEQREAALDVLYLARRLAWAAPPAPLPALYARTPLVVLKAQDRRPPPAPRPAVHSLGPTLQAYSHAGSFEPHPGVC
jgi:hypothetical protein